MATIKDVAKMAGVSPSTISKYMNGGNVREENVEAIRNAIAALDYRVNPFARNLKTQRSRSIGVLLPDITAPFFGNVMTALDKVLRENGYHSLISCYSANHGLERDNLRFLISTGVDGLIYMPENLSVEEFYELTANCSVPTVLIDRSMEGLPVDTVLVDNADAVYDAIVKLTENGHRRIATITGPKSVFSAKERLVGYLRALSDLGILYDDQLVISGQNEFATGYHGFEALMNLPHRPTAVFTTNYDITMGFITAARERGMRIGEDIAVFGFDCVDICAMMKPPLPVVHQPEQEMGQIAASYLIERLSGLDAPPRVTRLKCSLALGELV